MYRFREEGTGSGLREDIMLAACVILIAGMGLVTLLLSIGDDYDRFFKQVAMLTVGLGLFIFFVLVKLDWIRRKATVFLVILAAVLCIMCFIPFFRPINIETGKYFNTYRWLDLRIALYQPSELVKLCLPMFFAFSFDKKKDKPGSFSSGAFVVSVLLLALVFFQKDFSTSILIGFNVLVFFWITGMKKRWFVPLAGGSVLAGVFALAIDPMRRSRFISLNPLKDPTGLGFQTLNSKNAIMSGGLWGKGLGQGTWKIAQIPQIEDDFIFAAYAEEAGFLGVLLFFALFTVFAVLGYRAARRDGPLYNQLLAFGLVTMMVTQVLVNIGVTAGRLPSTGITLPFFSAGGSSLLTSFSACGLLVNICRQGIRGGQYEPSLDGEVRYG